MQIPKELESPFTYSWKLVIILLIIIFFIVGILLFYKYLYPKFIKIFRKARVPSLKTRYLEKLMSLLKEVDENRIGVREAYFKLSNIIRGFIKKASGLNVLNMSKEEIKKNGILNLGELMEEYYPPEFSKYSKGDIKSSIERTMEVIKRWN